MYVHGNIYVLCGFFVVQEVGLGDYTDFSSISEKDVKLGK